MERWECDHDLKETAKYRIAYIFCLSDNLFCRFSSGRVCVYELHHISYIFLSKLCSKMTYSLSLTHSNNLVPPATTAGSV